MVIESIGAPAETGWATARSGTATSMATSRQSLTGSQLWPPLRSSPWPKGEGQARLGNGAFVFSITFEAGPVFPSFICPTLPAGWDNCSCINIWVRRLAYRWLLNLEQYQSWFPVWLSILIQQEEVLYVFTGFDAGCQLSHVCL